MCETTRSARGKETCLKGAVAVIKRNRFLYFLFESRDHPKPTYPMFAEKSASQSSPDHQRFSFQAERVSGDRIKFDQLGKRCHHQLSISPVLETAGANFRPDLKTESQGCQLSENDPVTQTDWIENLIATSIPRF